MPIPAHTEPHFLYRLRNHPSLLPRRCTEIGSRPQSLHDARCSLPLLADFNYDQRIRHEGYDIEQIMPRRRTQPARSPTRSRRVREAIRPGRGAGMTGRPSRACATLAACLALLLPRIVAQVIVAPSAPASASSNQPHNASLDDYRAHLLQLTTLVAACAKARDMKTCDPALVGPDDEVPVSPAPNSERRLVRYGWLRVLLSKAQDKDAPAPKPAAVPADRQSWENVRPDPPTTTQLLQGAQTRLAADLAQTEAAASPLPDHAQERAAMKQVLAGNEYRNLAEDTARNSVLEKAGTWLNDLLVSAIRASARAPWLGRALVWGFIAAVSVALVWGLLQLERRWRIRLVPEDHGPAPGSASAIPWQLWLEDARRAAAAGLWREAIHFLYWAAISRLESKRLWPADRARTPREYLALVAPEDPRQPGLATLTGSFERVWYGGRPAAESDYQRAEQIASALISGSGATASSSGISGGAPQ
jgi:Domain of unknown function (DUF4129)